jgi:hypothetical protein
MAIENGPLIVDLPTLSLYRHFDLPTKSGDFP